MGHNLATILGERQTLYMFYFLNVVVVVVLLFFGNKVVFNSNGKIVEILFIQIFFSERLTLENFSLYHVKIILPLVALVWKIPTIYRSLWVLEKKEDPKSVVQTWKIGVFFVFLPRQISQTIVVQIQRLEARHII